MIKVDQIILDSEKGDCARATIASMFELDIFQVPNFIMFDEDVWFNVYYYFIYSLGFEYSRCLFRNKYENKLNYKDSINGYFDAAVPSKTFVGKTHAVVMDIDGMVVHDPNPNKLWEGINIFKTKELKYWYIFKKIK